MNRQIIVALMGLVVGISSTCFAKPFGADSAGVYCQVRCENFNSELGRSFDRDRDDFPWVRGAWGYTDFRTNTASFREIEGKCNAIGREALRTNDHVRDLIRFGFIDSNQCQAKPLAYAWYNPFSLYEIVVSDS